MCSTSTTPYEYVLVDGSYRQGLCHGKTYSASTNTVPYLCGLERRGGSIFLLLLVPYSYCTNIKHQALAWLDEENLQPFDPLILYLLGVSRYLIGTLTCEKRRLQYSTVLYEYCTSRMNDNTVYSGSTVHFFLMTLNQIEPSTSARLPPCCWDGTGPWRPGQAHRLTAQYEYEYSYIIIRIIYVSYITQIGTVRHNFEYRENVR